MSTYVNGELLKKWRREAMASMRAQYMRLQTAAESCKSYQDGNPGDYAKSLEIIAGCYLRAAGCFEEPSEHTEESNPSDQRAGASPAPTESRCWAASSESKQNPDGSYSDAEAM